MLLSGEDPGLISIDLSICMTYGSIK